ncbi:UvrD/REP helicase N-terminal domain-containing protein [Geodermatophilus siccatus]|uniref:DNA 3'-5' helicase n=1 Tax=Geodermatophilus siccatus TaxID=1137991 RepID=A0A1G9T2C5_9ACTN|nr:3'-5' exonuclease [Geodermatophilus siccatus]SDM41768.1 UvrD/REP helicase N-terminal domain-containing protein [Geodermatophilus siccatus]
MANVIMSKQFTKDLDVDGSLRPRAWEFLHKLMADHTVPGLHIEPINGSRDSRVRTGRVNDNYRAVLFLVAEQPEPNFVLAAIKKHDEANRLAARLTLRVNPVNGVLEFFDEEAVVTAPGPQPVIRPRVEDDVPGPLSGFKTSELTDVLGLPAPLAEAAVTAGDEDALLSLAADAPAWQADALLQLATGTAPEDIAAALRESAEAVGAEPGATADPVTEAERVERALSHPASQMEFVTIVDDDQLTQVLSGSFAAWRVFLHPDQRAYAYRDTYRGAFRLSGGAGTGKTVVALHRAHFLSQQNPKARIVLTTYTTTLADSLRAGLNELDPELALASALGASGVHVVGIDKLAREALAKAGDRALRAVSTHLGSLSLQGELALRDNEDRQLWEESVATAGESLPPHLRTPTFLTAEYRSVILGNGVTTREEYARVPRTGRGVRLSRAERLGVWAVVEAYRRRLSMEGKATFAELAALASAAVAAARPDGLADHVIVDEAQDLHTGHWRLLRSLVPAGPNELFICEDSHQRIYGEKVVLGRLGINIQGRSRRLTLNYRTTAQNLRFAVGVLEGAEVTDLEGEGEDVSGYRSPLRGPRPRLLPTPSLPAELDQIADVLKGWLAEPDVEPASLAVLVRSGAVRDLVQRGLADRQVTVQTVEGRRSRTAPAPSLLTMHRAKGLEFRKVVLAGVDESQVPAGRVIGQYPDDDRGDALVRERLLLYVASSRARDELVVTWHGSASPFLPSPLA